MKQASLPTHVDVGGVRLKLSQPHQAVGKWIGQQEVLKQLLACWLVVDEQDQPLAPRLVGSPGIGKTAVFGFLIGLIGAYEGFNTSRGTEGVGRAATTSVVVASLNIIFVDMLIIQLTLLLFGSG